MVAILYWNAVGLEANRVSHSNGKEEQTGPTLSSRALAIMHLAMFDAFVGVAKPQGNCILGLSHVSPSSARPAIGLSAQKYADDSMSSVGNRHQLMRTRVSSACR
jgi:hypothetical protein